MTKAFKAGILFCVIFTAVLICEETGNPLKDLPSKPGPHIEKIKALGDNEWLNLGCPAPDEKWGKEGIARGRSWGGRALRSAPDMRGAFFCGTGVHGYVKSDGHYMDDLWFYDINAHKWICLYPGANTKTLKLKLNEHNFEVNERGEYTPVSYLSHAYGNITYDTDLRKFVVIFCSCPWWFRALPQRFEWLEIPKQDWGKPYKSGKWNTNSRHPVFWDVATGKWERRFVKESGPKAWSGLAEYIPFMKKTLFSPDNRNGAVWLYDCNKNAWTKLKTSGPTPVSTGCYDPKCKRIWSVNKKSFRCLDLKTGIAREIKAKGQPEDFYCTNGTIINCDAASGDIVFHMRRTPKDKGNWKIVAYDPENNKWKTPADTFPEKVNTNYMSRHSFYDTELNAHFIYLAGDSSNINATVLVYRYKKNKKEK